MNEKNVPLFRGLTLEEIRAKFEFIDPEATLEYPWWYEKGDVPHLESEEEVRARVQIALKMIEERYPDQDVLLVGHGASAGAAIRLYGISCEPNLWKGLFNTSLSMIDPADATVPTMYCDTAHLTYGTTTSNFQLREEHDRDYLEQEWPEEIALPEGIAALRGAKILHLGDTYFRHYPYYRKLIETLRPEVIVHTGDTVEEVKIGRTPEALEEYRRKLAWLLEILQSTGARLILTPGNHDLPEEIAALAPNAECLPENSVVEIDGVACRIGHEGLHLTFDRPTFYGHSSRKDPWAGQKDLAEERRYFNALHSITVGSLSEDRFFHLPRPTVREHRP